MGTVSISYGRWVVRAGMALLILLLAGIAALYAWLQTDHAQQTMRMALEDALAGNLGYEVGLEGFRASFPLEVTAARLTLADSEGVWLEARQVRLGLTPSLDLASRVRLYHAGADSILIARVPLGVEPMQAAPSGMAEGEAGSGLDVYVDAVAVKQLALGPALTGLDGDIRLSASGHMAWHGKEERLAFSFKAVPDSLPAVPLEGLAVALQGDYDMRGETLALKLATRNLSDKLALEGQATIHLETGELAGQGELAIPRLEAWHPALEGRLKSGLSVAGTLTQPVVQATAQAEQLAVNGQALPDTAWDINIRQEQEGISGSLSGKALAPEMDAALSAVYRLAGDRLQVGGLKARYAGCEAAGDVALALDAMLASGTLAGSCADLGQFAAIAPMARGGAVSYRIAASHQAGRQAMEANLDATRLRTDYGTAETIRLRARSSDVARLLPDRVDVEADKAVVGGVAFTRLAVSMQPDEAAWRVTASASGSDPVAYDLRASGRIEAPSADDISVSVLSLGGALQGKAVALGQPLDLNYRAGAVGWRVPQLSLGDAALSSQGVVEPDGKVQATATLQHIRLGAWQADLPDLLRGAVVGGRLDVSGTLAAPEASLDARLAQVRLAEGIAPVTLPVAVHYADKAARVLSRLDDKQVAKADIDMRLPVTLSLAPPGMAIDPKGAIGGSISLDMSLDTIARLLLPPDQVVRGAIAGTLAFGGIWDNPAVNGALHFTDGYYHYLPLGMQLRPVTGTVVARGNALEWRDWVAKDKKGNALTGKGTLEIGRLGGFNFAFTANASQMGLLNHPNAHGLVSGDIAFQGDEEGARLTGTIRPRPLEIRLPERFTSEVPVVNVVDTIPPRRVEARKPLPYPIALDVTVNAEEQVFVRGWGVDAEIGGTIQLTGFADNPELRGKLATKRGRYEEFGKQFIVKEGTLTFEGDMPPSPYLHIVASARAGDIEVKPTISGPLLKPELTIASTPSLPQDEALSRLLFGRDSRTLSAVQAVQLANSIRKLSGKGPGGFDPVSRARQLLGVDDLRFDGAGDDPQNARVGIGKYLRDDIYFQVERGIQEGTGRASVELEITPNISVESSTADTGHTRIGVNWKRDY